MSQVKTLTARAFWVVSADLPPPVLNTPSIVQQAAKLSKARLAECVTGMERRCAASIQRNPAWRSGINPVPFDRFADRPAFETVMIEHWRILTHGSLASHNFDSLVSDLTGMPSAPRSCEAWCDSSSTGRPTQWPSPSVAAGWIGRLVDGEREAAGSFSAAVFAYGQTVLSHPYSDGNGRLARALFTAVLARRAGLDAPILPLGPIMYANHKRLAAAVRTVGIAGDWSPLSDFLVEALELSVRFARIDLARSEN